jgi:hypothetical protein
LNFNEPLETKSNILSLIHICIFCSKLDNFVLIFVIVTIQKEKMPERLFFFEL